MSKLSRADLFSLESYAECRAEFRTKVLAHKKNRQVALGPNARLCFEDRLTIQYQIQEMLRVERIFEASGIDEELNAYNPLIPDGSNLKATFMIEYEDVAERREALARMSGIEHKLWLQVAAFDKCYGLADEDLDRSNDEKTSAVHFVRFELDSNSVAAMKDGKPVVIGIDHPAYPHAPSVLAPQVREALAADLR